ncbi:transposase [Haloferula chungangensis]|uniref:Transposase n=1 Tax=Haloferula chungangensis TaxID=1048331 RepID=A0ABW2L280_9BACT
MTWDALRYFNELADTTVTNNRLPHWNQSGASYFLTFRLADSLPSHLLHELNEERTAWIAKHPQPWDLKTEAEYHKIFSVKVDRWLDAGYGECLLKQTLNAEIVSSAFHHFDADRYLLHSFVVMPNHVHVLVSTDELQTVATLIHSWKRHTSREINKARNTIGRPLWQRDYFDRIIRNARHFIRVVRYIRSNVRQYPPAIHYESPWVRELE